MLARKHNWQSALDRFLLDHQCDKFSYGTWDCCLFVCDAIQVMTGVDVAAPFRGAYDSRTKAMTAVRKYTGKASVRAVVEKVTADNAMLPVPILRAQRGDVVLIRRGARDFSLGIVALNGQDAVVLAPGGIARIPVADAIQGWRV